VCMWLVYPFLFVNPSSFDYSTILHIAFLFCFRLESKFFFFFLLILFNSTLIFLTKTYTPLGGFHSSQRRSPFQHWAASQPMCVALSKRVLVEYYIAEANGYKPKVIFKCTNYRTSRVSKTHTYIKLNNITNHIREAKCIFETKF
jgi:hypothetical protein